LSRAGSLGGAALSARTFDVALGVSAAAWAVLRVVEAPASVPTFAIAALNACVAVLFFVRAPAVRETSARDVVASLPSVVVAGVALEIAPATWPLAAEIALAVGAATTIASLASLGRSFAVFPSQRALVTRGPYRVLRHPAYAGELAMIAACCAARADALAASVMLAAIAAVATRIVAEERALAAAYAAYARAVRWRLVPGVW